jgi:hypothetical protein
MAGFSIGIDEILEILKTIYQLKELDNFIST